MNEVFVLDPPGGTGQQCKCNKQAMFVLGVCGHELHMCEICIAEVAKRIIDGLV